MGTGAKTAAQPTIRQTGRRSAAVARISVNITAKSQRPKGQNPGWCVAKQECRQGGRAAERDKETEKR